jgi:hypothetical protein
MSKLVCEKCKGKLFTKTGTGVILAIYVEGGTSPSYENYKCSNCNHQMSIYRPSIPYTEKPVEIDIPEQDWDDSNPFNNILDNSNI